MFHLCVSLPLDVIGVVRSVGDITKVIAKQSQKEITKREVFLVDEGQVQVRLTLWSSDVGSRT